MLNLYMVKLGKLLFSKFRLVSDEIKLKLPILQDFNIRKYYSVVNLTVLIIARNIVKHSEDITFDCGLNFLPALTRVLPIQV